MKVEIKTTCTPALLEAYNNTLTRFELFDLHCITTEFIGDCLIDWVREAFEENGEIIITPKTLQNELNDLLGGLLPTMAREAFEENGEITKAEYKDYCKQYTQALNKFKRAVKLKANTPTPPRLLCELN